MRHVINVVSVGILLGLSLFAIAILTALYATPWQASTVLSVLCGIFASVSLYFGERSRLRALEVQLHQARTGADALNLLLQQERKASNALTSELESTKSRLNDLTHLLCATALFLEVTIAPVELEEVPPLFI
jgi:septal ring factor EnvC (AmiA/AmiB activator)